MSALPFTPSISETAAKARTFRDLHKSSDQPLLLANVYDATSARIVASFPGCKALATASFANAHSIGKADDTLTLEENLALVQPVAAVAHQLNLPLTVDIQDGYAPQGDLKALKGVATRLITELGAVGVNLEDSWHHSKTGEMMDEDDAVERIKTFLGTAKELGVNDFVINARSDTFLMGGSLDESIRRGKKYLEAGAETVFIFWNPTKEMKVEDVKRVIEELGGKVNIGCRLGEIEKDGPTPSDLGKMGAVRVSVGPQLYLAAVGAMKNAAETIFGV